MKILLNETEKEIKVSSIATLSDIIVEVKKDLKDKQIITEVKLNGKLLESNWYKNSKKIYLLDEDSLELTTSDSNIIAKNALENSKDSLKTIISDFEKIADSFRLEDSKTANKHFSITIENLHWFLKILEDSANLMGTNINEFQIENKTFKQYILNFSNKLNEILETQKREDWILLADMIEYELVPQLEKMESLYENLGI